MNLEQDLSDALHGAYGAALPSPDLRVRVVGATHAKRASYLSSVRGPLAALSGVAAVLLIGALVLAGFKPPAPGPQAASPSASPSGLLTHYAVGRLSFDYPSVWKSRVNVLPWVMGFWTGSDPADCLTPTPQPAGPQSHCGRQAPLLPGTLYVTVGDYTTLPTEPEIDPTQTSALPAGGRYVTVAGQPAILVTDTTLPVTDTTTATVETLDWTIAQPKEPHTRVQIHAEIAAPGSEEMQAQIEAMVASLRFSSAVKPLDLSAADAIAGRWMTSTHVFPGLGCFSATPGEIVTGVITQYAWGPDGRPQMHTLSKPLPVSCLMTIAPVPSIGLWKLTFTQSWSADVDRAAGSSTLVFWLDMEVSDLDAWANGVGGGPDVLGDPIPYSN